MLFEKINKPLEAFVNRVLTPAKLEKFAVRFTPIFLLALIPVLALGLIYALYLSPEDYQQEGYVRIMYVHVPSAWMAMKVYALMSIMGFAFLVWRNPLCYLIARAAAPIGAVFTAICLITGSIWGYPTWGTWWVWDARLTSVLILFFLYLGFIALNGSFADEEKEAKSSSILALVGGINLPIIKYSVEWWNTLHQPASVFRIEGSAIDSSMMTPLMLMFAAWILIFLVVLLNRIRSKLLEKKLKL